MPKTKPTSRGSKSQDLKSFRRDISVLKKRGLIDKKIDARKVKPTAALNKKRAVYSDVLSGDARIYTVSRKQAKDLKDTGHKVIGNKLILSSEPGTRADYRKGKITVKPLGKTGFQRVELPIPYRNLRQWLEEAKNDPALENLKRPTDQWAFQFFGHNSYSTFHDLNDAIDRLEHYETTGESLDEDDAEEMENVYRGISIYRVKRGAWPKSYKSAKTNGRKKASRDRLKKRRPKAYKRMLEKDAARKKKARLKDLEGARAKERERQRKHRERKRAAK